METRTTQQTAGTTHHQFNMQIEEREAGQMKKKTVHCVGLLVKINFT